MKRSPLKRGKKRISPQSKRRKKVALTYKLFKDLFLEEHYRCEFDWRNIMGTTQRCGRKSTELHHILPRGRSGKDEDLIDAENVMAICREHHTWIHGHQEEALARGFLKKARPMEEKP